MKNFFINIEQIPILISKIHYNSSWNDPKFLDHLYQSEPIRISIYNEVLKFSKEELESVKTFDKSRPYEIWNCLLSYPDALVFSAFVEKKAFWDHMSEISQILISYIDKDTSLNYYAFILEMNIRHSNKTNILEFLKNMDTPEKVKLTPLLFKQFFECIPGKDNFEENFSTVIQFCISNIDSPLASFLLEQLKLANVDINHNFPIQFYLKQSEKIKSNTYSKLFISFSDISQLKKLLNKDFRFEEHDYRTFYNETLFTALIKSENENMIKTILPYLSHIIPHDHNQEKQTQLIESYKEKPYYDFISSYYFKYLLELKLENKVHVSKPKL